MQATAESPTSPNLPENRARAPFHLMAKPMGPKCNLDCSYCFYLEKERLYPAAENFKMPPEVLETYIRSYIEAQPGSSVSFSWQGGEPTLAGVEFFKQVVALQQRYANGKTIENAIQTNGTLLDEAWGEFLAHHRFLVGLSIDGPAPLHNAFRLDRGKRPTFDSVMNGIGVLRKHKVEFNTLTTVHRRNSRAPLEVYRFLKQCGAGVLQFIPIVERIAATAPSGDDKEPLAPPPDKEDAGSRETSVTEWSVLPADYGTFLCTIFDEWVRHDVGRVFVQQFDTALSNWVGAPAGVCVFSEHCGNALAIEHNGDVFSCDHYVYPRYQLGNLLRDSLVAMVESPKQREFCMAKATTLPRYCKECPVLFACHGDCPKHRFFQTPRGEPGLSYLCASYRKFFTHIDSPMRTMSALLSLGRAPAEIMSLPKTRWL